MLRCMLKSVVGRIYMNPLQTLPRNQIFLLQVEKNLFKKLDASSTCWATCCFNLQERNFDVWQFLRWVEILFVQQRFWTRNATMFRLQVSAICCSYYFTCSSAVRAFSRNARHRFPDIGSTSTSAVWFVFQHYLRRTRNVYCTYWELILYVEGRNRGLHGILTSSLNDLERYQIYSSFMT